MPDSSTTSGTSASQNLFDSLFNAAAGLASPLARRLIDEPASDRAASNQSIGYNQLNGSGAPDPVGQSRSPQTLGEFLFGMPGGGTVRNAAAPASMNWMWIAVFVLVGWFVIKKL